MSRDVSRDLAASRAMGLLATLGLCPLPPSSRDALAAMPWPRRLYAAAALAALGWTLGCAVRLAWQARHAPTTAGTREDATGRPAWERWAGAVAA